MYPTIPKSKLKRITWSAIAEPTNPEHNLGET